MRAFVYVAIIGCAVVYGSQWVGDLWNEPPQNHILGQQLDDPAGVISDHQMRVDRAGRVLSRIVNCINEHLVRHQEREAVADCNYYDDEAVAFHEDEISGRISREESNTLMQQAQESPRLMPQ